MTDIFLAVSTGPSITEMQRHDWEKYPINILVAFPYLKNWMSIHNPRPKKTMLDSGAYSAWNAGHEIDIEALIKESKSGRWDETVSLDVIGDWKGSVKNALYMKEQGSPAFPVFHFGDPWHVLEEYCETFDRVGLSCRFGETVPQSLKWVEQCFARTYPHKYHSFGWVGQQVLREFPFYTADTASWVRMPAEWGNWKMFGKMSVRSMSKKKISLLSEIEWYIRYERELKTRWRNEMQKLEKL